MAWRCWLLITAFPSTWSRRRARSTLTRPYGQAIVIEQRPADEVTTIGGTSVAPEGVAVDNAAFDVTPHELVTAYVIEDGVEPGGRA